MDRGPARPRRRPRARHAPQRVPDARLLDLAGARALQRRQPHDRRDPGRVLVREGRARGPRAEPAPGSAGRLLVQPLQRLRPGRLRPLLDLVVRARRGAPARAGPLPRPAGRGDAAPGDALLPRQLPEHGAAHAGRAPGRRNQREPRPRAAGAAHGRRRRRLHAGRRDRRLALPDRPRHRQRRGERQLPVPPGKPRRRRQAGVRAFGRERGRPGRRPAAARPPRRAPRHGPVHLPQARRSASSPTIRPERSSPASRTSSCGRAGTCAR